MNGLLSTIILSTLLANAAVFAESEDTAHVDRDDDLPGSGADAMGIDLEVGDVTFAGNPLQRLVANWPEDLVIAPIPSYSPQLGWSLTLGGVYFLQARDENSASPPSTVGGFVMGAENGSYVYGGGANLHLLNDRLRMKVAAVYADIRYRFYGIGNEQGDSGIDIDILQNGPLYMANGTWRIWKKLYLGLGIIRGSVETRLRIDLPDTSFFDPALTTDIGAYTFPMEIDSRDHEQFPREGWLVTAKTSLYRESAGSDFDAETYKFSANHYWPMRERDVLASRIVIKATSDNVPFFLLSSFGGSTDLRGYPSGRYRDRMMVAMQTEYRWQFADRWIMTGFAGVGEVAESFSEFGKNLLPAAGIGIRFVLSQKHRVGLSADLAVGNDGAEFYFGVGETF